MNRHIRLTFRLSLYYFSSERVRGWCGFVYFKCTVSHAF